MLQNIIVKFAKQISLFFEVMVYVFLIKKFKKFHVVLFSKYLMKKITNYNK